MLAVCAVPSDCAPLAPTGAAALAPGFYSLFLSIFALAGIWISGRQVWLQGLPEDEVPLCGPPLEYIIDVFPFADVINALFMGDGNWLIRIRCFLHLLQIFHYLNGMKMKIDALQNLQLNL